MNWSETDVGDVPPGVVTLTSTVPVPAGEVAVMEVALWTTTLVAAMVPKWTAVAPVKAVPVIVPLVPPASGPALGATLVTVGAPIYANWSLTEVAEVPPGVATVTFTIPVPAGDVAVIGGAP